MKSKKVTMLVAALVVAVVAAAGIGYATTTYTATTQNSANTVDVTYVTLSQSGNAKYATGSFINSNYFNTVTTWENSTEVTTYTVTGELTDKVTPVTGVDAYIISKNGTDGLTLTLKDTEGASYKLTISTAASMAATGGISYYFGLNDGTNTTWCSAAGATSGSNTVWEIPQVAASTAGIPYTVVVAASGSTTTTPEELTPIVFEFVASSA